MPSTVSAVDAHVRAEERWQGSTAVVDDSSATFPRPSTTGNLIVAYVVVGQHGRPSASRQQQQHVRAGFAGVDWGGVRSAQVFYAKNVAGGTNTVTATFASRRDQLRAASTSPSTPASTRTNPLDIASPGDAGDTAPP